MTVHEAYILSGVRTPIGALGGGLSEVPAPKLGSICIREALKRAQVSAESVDEVLMGNVVSAGLGQNPARQACLGAGLPVSVGAVTINKVCGSGLKAVMLASQSLRLGESQVVVAGGMESMSLAPYLLLRARQGYRLGDGTLVDSVLYDGLVDAYGGEHMGLFGERCVQHFHLNRKEQDDLAVRSYTRASKAMTDGIFQKEIVPVEVVRKKQTVTVSQDERPLQFNEEKLRSLPPAFEKSGTITAGNASSIDDGGAALALASDKGCNQYNLKPLARVVSYCTFSCDPAWFSVAPKGALRKLLEQTGWTVESTDLFEINEPFAAVNVVTERELNIPPEKVNIHGGAVALGHPIGCTGARILVTLLNALRHTGGLRGIACLCLGGGEAVALAVEMVY